MAYYYRENVEQVVDPPEVVSVPASEACYYTPANLLPPDNDGEDDNISLDHYESPCYEDGDRHSETGEEEYVTEHER